MLWELFALAIIILFLGISVFFMARKTSSNQANISIDGINVEELIDQLAKAIGKEIAEQLANKSFVERIPSNTQFSSQQETNEIISMDNSIIPIKLDTSKLESNIENIAKQEIKVDNDLEKNKAKLADLMKKKKG